jgi:hypothetical protein
MLKQNFRLKQKNYIIFCVCFCCYDVVSECVHQGLNFIAAIAVEGEQNAVDHCGNDGNFLPYSVIFYIIHCALLF